MRQLIIDSVTGRSYWYDPEMKYGKVSDSEAEVIMKTNMTPSDFKDCFNWTKWWCACSKENRPAQGWTVDKSSSFPFCFNNGGVSKLIVFDTAVLDGKQVQVIRTLQFVDICEEDVKHYYAKECSRALINSGNIKFVEFSSEEGNRPEVYVPFFGIQETKNLHYSIGGYYGDGPSVEMPQESYYYFRSTAPGIKPAEVIKKLLRHVVESIESMKEEIEPGSWDRMTFNRTLMFDLFIQGGLTEELIKNDSLLVNMFSPVAFHPGRNIEDLLHYKKSVRIGLRHGAMKWMDTPVGRETYLDVLRMLDSLGKDMFNPKYVAPENLMALHAQLIFEGSRRRRKKLAEQVKETFKQYNPMYRREKGDLLKKKWESKNIIITPLQNIEEFMQVGDQLHICVFTAGYYKKVDSLICKAVSKEDNRLLACIELNQDTMKLVQCRGLQNGIPEKEKDILKLIKKISV